MFLDILNPSSSFLILGSYFCQPGMKRRYGSWSWWSMPPATKTTGISAAAAPQTSWKNESPTCAMASAPSSLAERPGKPQQQLELWKIATTSVQFSIHYDSTYIWYHLYIYIYNYNYIIIYYILLSSSIYIYLHSMFMMIVGVSTNTRISITCDSGMTPEDS